MACDRCHSVGDPVEPDNRVLLDITHGFGSQRFPYVSYEVCDACDEPYTYQLDAVIDADGQSQVVVGHDYPAVSRPLTLEEIAAMRAIVVDPAPPFVTPIPPDAATNPAFPASRPMD